jgi:hypothetical protein
MNNPTHKGHDHYRSQRKPKQRKTEFAFPDIQAILHFWQPGDPGSEKNAVYGKDEPDGSEVGVRKKIAQRPDHRLTDV